MLLAPRSKGEKAEVPPLHTHTLIIQKKSSKRENKKDRLLTLLLLLREFERIKFCSPENHQKTIGFLTISGGIEVI